MDGSAIGSSMSADGEHPVPGENDRQIDLEHPARAPAPYTQRPYTQRTLFETIFFRPGFQTGFQTGFPPEPRHSANAAELRAGWRAGLYVAFFILFFSIFNTLGVFLQRRFSVLGGGMAAGQFTAGSLFRQEVVMAASAVVSALLMSVLEQRPFGDYGMPPREAFGRRFWQGAVWGMAQITALVLAIAVLGGYSFGGLANHGSVLVRYGFLWGGFFVIVGITEEFLFRGYLQFTLASGMGFWPAATVLSLGFGAVHLSNLGEGPVGALSVFVIGMLFCLTLRRTGNLWFAIGMHAAFDFGESYIYAVPDSGLVVQGQLLKASLHGPRWLTGGSIGPEGSALAFVVLAVVFVVFDRAYPRRAYGPG
jgi:hypothetical protein